MSGTEQGPVGSRHGRRRHCEICGEFIPFPVEEIDDEDGRFHLYCHECSGEKEALLPYYQRDKALLHDLIYHGDLFWSGEF